MNQLKILELFSGMECISNAFRNKGHECFTVDYDKRFPSSLHVDIRNLTSDMILDLFGKPDIIFLGTDCTTYSVAAIGKHRQKMSDGTLVPKTEKARLADELNIHCKQLIKELNPKIYIFENPVGGFRKMNFVQDIPYRNTTTYCQYGFKYRKATDFFSNIDLHLKPPCKNGDSCHEAAKRGARTGLQAITDPALKAIYPPELCRHIVNECLDVFEKNENPPLWKEIKGVENK